MKITVINDDYFVKLTETQLMSIEEVVPGVELIEVQHDTITLEDLIDSEVVFGRVPTLMLKDLKRLKWLHLASAGADGLMDASLYANDSITLTKSSGTFGIPIAEHVLCMMLALSRNLGHYYQMQRDGIWCDIWPEFQDISGSTVFVLGLGDIGTEVCRLLSCFGCNIVGFRNDASKPHKLISDVRPISLLRESLPEADYVVICAPGTEKTDKLFGREEFARMKKRAIIVNIGRGRIIDADALVEALNEQQILGAGLDVTEPEPLPPNHPLWSAKNVLITPHVSAATQITIERRVNVFIDLLKRYTSGLEMYNIVDFDAGY